MPVQSPFDPIPDPLRSTEPIVPKQPTIFEALYDSEYEQPAGDPPSWGAIAFWAIMLIAVVLFLNWLATFGPGAGA